MMNGSQVTPASPPVERRATRNGRTILGAALQVLDEESWSALTPRHVAEVSGLSRTAVLARHPDRSAIGASVWREHVASTLLEAWSGLVAVIDSTQGSESELQSAIQPFLNPDRAMRVAAELIFVGRYDTEVARAISETVGEQFVNWTTPGIAGVSPTRAAQRALTIGLAHGYLTEARRNHTVDIDLSGELAKWAYALAHPAQPSPLPEVNAQHLDDPVLFDTNDPMVEAVLASTLDLVGSVGFDAATIEAICNASGFTRSVIFNRYKTKRDLFLDATDQMLSQAIGLNDEYMTRLATTHGVSIAEACMLREFMRPERAHKATVAFEQLRLSWHDVDLLAAIDSALIENQRRISQENPSAGEGIQGVLVTASALGHGIVTIAGLNPVLGQLPLDVVLVPFNGNQSLP